MWFTHKPQHVLGRWKGSSLARQARYYVIKQKGSTTMVIGSHKPWLTIFDNGVFFLRKRETGKHPTTTCCQHSNTQHYVHNREKLDVLSLPLNNTKGKYQYNWIVGNRCLGFTLSMRISSSCSGNTNTSTIQQHTAKMHLLNTNEKNTLYLFLENLQRTTIENNSAATIQSLFPSFFLLARLPCAYTYSACNYPHPSTCPAWLIPTHFH